MVEVKPKNGYNISLPLDRILSARSETHPDDIAITDSRNFSERVDYTYRHFADIRDKIAFMLVDAGVEPNQRVGLYLEDRINSLGAVYGIWSAGATLVPLDHRQTYLNLLTIARDSDLVCILFDTEFETVAQLRAELTNIKFLQLGGLPTSGAPSFNSLSKSEQTAIIAYTSGTTDNPKGVVMRHSHLRRAYAIANQSLLRETPKRFGTVFRVGGLGVLGLNYFLPMESGSSTVILPELTLGSAKRYLDVLQAYEIDFLYLVPILVQIMQRLTKPDCGYNHFDVVTGAAPISKELHSQYQEKFDVALRNIYGMTEATFGIFYGRYVGPKRAAWDLGSEINHVVTRVRLPDGSILDGPGEGILEVSGPTVTEGYLSNEQATDIVFKSGWIDTGDIVLRDAEGNHIISGRSKDVVIRGGFNIHLDEVDHALAAHPDVLAACCVAVKSNGGGEAIAALVYLQGNCTGLENELLDYVRDRIGRAKVPNRLVITKSDLPRNSSGKIVRKQVLSIILGCSTK